MAEDPSDEQPAVDSPERERKRLLIALRNARPGELFFVEMASHEARRALPGQLKEQGLLRRSVYIDLSTLPPRPPALVLGGFLEAEAAKHPEILFVDGMEAWIETKPHPEDALESFNLAREDLAHLGVVVVFVVPSRVVDLIRTRAHNLWSWRAHHLILDRTDANGRLVESQTTERAFGGSYGEPRRARERRVEVLKRILLDEETKGRPPHANPTTVIPLAFELNAVGRFDEALVLLKRIRSHLCEMSPINAAQVLEALGAALAGARRYDEAEPVLREALFAFQSLLGESHFKVIVIMGVLADIHFDRKEYLKSIRLIEKTIDLASRLVDSASEQAPFLFMRLFLVHRAAGHLAEAETAIRRAIEFTEESRGRQGPLFPQLLGRYGEFLVEQRRFAEAEPILLRAVDAYEGSHELLHETYYLPVLKLMTVYRQSHEVDKARAILDRAIAKLESSEDTPPSVIETLRERGAALLEGKEVALPSSSAAPAQALRNQRKRERHKRKGKH